MKGIRRITVLIILLCTVYSGYGQSVLNRTVTLDVNRQRLDQVLEIISNKADCYFSYSSSVVRKDSLVTLSVRNKTIKEVLSLLFNTSFEFRESGSYVIIRKAPIRMTMITKKAEMEDKIYTVSGYVYDEQSDAAIPDASVYEKKLLASALTNELGFFKLKLKSSKAATATLTVSKESYEDTSILIQPTALLNSVGMIGHWAGKGALDMANSREWRQFVKDHLPEVANRIGDDPSYLEFGSGVTLRKIREAGYWPLAKLDMLTAASVAIGAYQKYAHGHGLAIDFARPDKKAVEYAQLMVRRLRLRRPARLRPACVWH